MTSNGFDSKAGSQTWLRVLTAAKRRVGLGLEQKSWRTDTAGMSSRLVVLFKLTMACAASYTTISDLWRRLQVAGNRSTKCIATADHLASKFGYQILRDGTILRRLGKGGMKAKD